MKLSHNKFTRMLDIILSNLFQQHFPLIYCGGVITPPQKQLIRIMMVYRQVKLMYAIYKKNGEGILPNFFQQHLNALLLIGQKN